MKRKLVSVLMVATLGIAVLAGCNSSTTSSSSSTDSAADSGSSQGSSQTQSFDTSKTISVITREAGSGTRDAFVELTGVLEEDDAGNETDNTSKGAVTVNSTQAVMSNVAGNEAAIGYISLGSLNDTVKAIKIDGAEATPETVKDGSYTIARPFNIATKTDGQLSEVAQDFIDYILSTEGQQVVTDNGYIALEDTKAYAGSNPEGKVVVAGSSSVSPVMEKLKEAYEAINTNATIEIQTTDSSSGMTAAIEGTCDIGMASRALKDEEVESLTPTNIAMDGIAVVVNNANTCEDLTIDQVKEIFTGNTTVWSDVIK